MRRQAPQACGELRPSGRWWNDLAAATSAAVKARHGPRVPVRGPPGETRRASLALVAATNRTSSRRGIQNLDSGVREKRAATEVNTSAESVYEMSEADAAPRMPNRGMSTRLVPMFTTSAMTLTLELMPGRPIPVM